jgi:predicted aspartyl protease
MCLGSLLAVTFACAPTILPLKLIDHYPVVEGVYVNGTGPFHFLVDTGFQSTAVDERLAEKLGLVPDYLVTLVTQAGAKNIPASKRAPVTLRGTTVQVEMIWLDLATARRVDRRIDGVIGQDFLSRFNYLIDYAARRLVLSMNSRTTDPRRLGETGSFSTVGRPAAGACALNAGDMPEHPAGMRVPFERSDGRIVVGARISGRTLKLVLDSGTAELVIFGQALGGDVRVMTNAGTATGTRTRLSRVKVGEHSFVDVPAVVVARGEHLTTDGLLPARLFDSIYVNHASRHVILEPSGALR